MPAGPIPPARYHRKEFRRGTGLKLEDWLLAEATRLSEEAADSYRLDDTATREAARRAGGVDERIVARARMRPEGADLRREIRHTLGVLRWVAGGWLVLGALAGATAAANLRMGGDTIALSYALLALLGIPLLLLVVWLLAALAAPGTRGAGIPGRLAFALAGRLGVRTGRRHVAGALAELGRLGGRRLMAAVTHGFWTAFFAGCIGWIWLLFLGLRFDFSWETTLMADPWVEVLVIAIGTPPAWAFGLEIPNADQVQAALIGHSSPGDRRLWAGYLIGALGLYGLAPRGLLALVSLWRWRRMRLPLALDRTGYLRLLPALAGASEAVEPAGPPPAQPGVAGPRRNQARAGPGARLAIGFELDGNEPGWPPEDPALRVLGRADTREQRRQIEQAAARVEPPPSKIVVFVSLARTPDRGTGHWLDRLAAIAPLEIRLLGEPGSAARRADWVALAERFGLPEPRKPDGPSGDVSPAPPER